MNLCTRMSRKQSLQTLSYLFVKFGGFTLHLKHFSWEVSYVEVFTTKDVLVSSRQSHGFN